MNEKRVIKTVLVPGVPWPAKDTPVLGRKVVDMFQKWQTVADALDQFLKPKAGTK